MSKAAAAKIEEPIAEPAAPTIDERVATVLTSEDHHPSETLSALIAEVETAISAADEAGQKARAAAVDPRVIDHGASGRAFDAEHAAHRLRNGLAALQQLHQEALAHEKVAAWHRNVDIIDKEVAELHGRLVPMAKRAEAAELEYHLACQALDDITPEIYALMARCDALDAKRPSGESRWIAQPPDGLDLSRFVTKKVEAEAEPVTDYSIATRVWQTAGPALTHEEIIAADEKRRADEQIWLHDIHEARETRRMEIEAEIHARTRAATQERRDWENGL
jgi:hypothetical protein